MRGGVWREGQGERRGLEGREREGAGGKGWREEKDEKKQGGRGEGSIGERRNIRKTRGEMIWLTSCCPLPLFSPSVITTSRVEAVRPPTQSNQSTLRPLHAAPKKGRSCKETRAGNLISRGNNFIDLLNSRFLLTKPCFTTTCALQHNGNQGGKSTQQQGCVAWGRRGGVCARVAAAGKPAS